MKRENKTKQLRYELGRYKKKVEDQAETIRALKKQLEAAGAGAVQLMQYADSVCIQTAVSYGEREYEDGVLIGYRLELPLIHVRELLKMYEMRCRKDEEKQTLIIGVMARAKPDEEQ